MTIQVRDGNGNLQTVETINDLIAMVASAAKQDTLHADLVALLAGPIPTTDAGTKFTTVFGIGTVPAPFTSADQHSTKANVSNAPTSGQKIVVDDLIISTDTDMAVTFYEESTAYVCLGPLYVSAKSPAQITPRGKFKLYTADKRLQVQTSVAGNITITVAHHSEP